MSAILLLSSRFLGPVKELNRDLRMIFVSNILGAFGVGLYNAVWPNYIAKLGGDPIAVGTVFSITYAVSTLVYLPGGWLADRFERRAVFVVGSFVATPTFLIYAWARTWTDLIPGVVLMSVTIAVMPAFVAYVSDSVSKSRAMSSFGVVYAGNSAGLILSPIVGGWLLTVTDFSVLFYGALALWVASTLLLVPLTPQPPAPRHKDDVPRGWFGFWSLFKEPGVLGWMVFLAVALSTVQLATPFIPTFLTDVYGFSVVANQYAGSARFLGAALLGIGLGRVGDRWSRGWALALCLLAFAGGGVLLVLGGSIAVVGFSMLLLGVVVALRSVSDSIIGQMTPKGRSGQIYGVYFTLMGAGQLATPYLGGVLYMVSPWIPFTTAAVICVVGAALLLTRGAQHKPKA